MLFLAALILGTAMTPDPPQGTARPATGCAEARGTVVFVCEHGTVKSVIAAELFNREARRRQSQWRAVSRGTSPDAAVPAGVAENLRRDGFDVTGFTPRRLEEADVATADHVVSIGADSAFLAGKAKDAVSHWPDVPPASTQYAASRDLMSSRIHALLDRVAGPAGSKCP